MNGTTRCVLLASGHSASTGLGRGRAVAGALVHSSSEPVTKRLPVPGATPSRGCAAPKGTFPDEDTDMPKSGGKARQRGTAEMKA